MAPARPMLKAVAAGIMVAAGCLFLPIMPGPDLFTRLLEPAREFARGCSRPLLAGLSERKRTKEIEEALPVFLRQTAACLKASLTVRQTVGECARTVPGALGEELAAANRELDSGISLDDSMDSLVKRVENKELAMTAAVLKAGARYGGNISGAAQSLSGIARRRQAAKRETYVLTAQARYSSLILGALPVAFFLFFPAGDGRGPAGVLSNPAGWIVVTAGLALNIGGFMVMRKLTRQDLS